MAAVLSSKAKNLIAMGFVAVLVTSILVFLYKKSSDSYHILVYDNRVASGGFLYNCVCSSGTPGDSGWRWRPDRSITIPGVTNLCPNVSLPPCPPT